MLQLYIGDGKGKTTAAIGLAVRAKGRGFRVAVIQFLKGKRSGEFNAAKRYALFSIFKFGRKEFVQPDNLTDQDYQKAEKGVKFASRIVQSGDYELVILDEILTAVNLHLIPEDRLIAIVDNCPPRTELAMTGRDAPESIKSKADLITEMKKIKHYYDKDVKARRGIEF